MEQKTSSAIDPALVPSRVSIEVVSSGSAQLAPCLLVKTPLKIYLFNVPEGTTRYIKSFHVREVMVNDIFFTRALWSNFGGLIGFLLNRGPTNITRLHGPPNLKLFVEKIRSDVTGEIDFFHDDSSENKAENLDAADVVGSKTAISELDEFSYKRQRFEDPAMRISYIPVFEMSIRMDNDGKNSNKETNSGTLVDVAFLLQLKPSAKKMNAAKIMELNIPKGPLLGKLKAGQPITLPDGRSVHPDDVLEFDHSLDEKPNLLVVECSSLKKLPSLISSTILEPFVNGTEQLNYAVHFTPNCVLESDEYRRWIRSFGESCTHLILNGTGPMLPLIDSMYTNRHIQHSLCAEIFPELYPKDIDDQRVVLPQLDKNVLIGVPFSRMPLRDKKVKNTQADEEEISLNIEAQKREIEEKILTNEVKNKIHEFTKFAEETPQLVDDYPKITFLGTASAVPSKYRTVSSYVLETNENCALMIDCGEGSYGQLLTLYGHEMLPQFLTKLRAIFITHAHLDHTLGTTTVILKRQEAFLKLSLPYRPLIIVCSKLVRTHLNLYSKSFQNLEDLVSFVDCSTVSLHSNANTDEKMDDSRSYVEVTRRFDTNLFSPNEWNLKSVTAVQVIHSEINACGFVFDDFVKGRRIVFSGDTISCNLLVEQGKNADVLIHEATFEDGLEDDAYRKKHSTMGQAVEIGRRMNAKYTILTHFSTRYRKVPPLPEYLEGCNVGIAMDHMVVRYRHLPMLPKLIPVYRVAYESELNSLQRKSPI